MEKGPSTFAEYWTFEEAEVIHFNKHGYEFGFDKITEYSKAAKNFADNNQRGIKSFRAKNGSIYKFSPKTGQFMIVSKEGRIVTYYRATLNHYWNKFNENQGTEIS